MKKLITILMVTVVLTTLFVGCKKEAATAGETLITVEDIKVSKTEALFYLVSMQNYYESYYGAEALTQPFSEDGTTTLGDELKNQSLELAKNINLAVYVAGKQDISLTDEEKATQAESAKSYLESLDPLVVEKYGFTIEFLQSVFEKSALEQKIVETFEVPEDQIETDVASLGDQDPYLKAILEFGAEGSATAVRARHILIKTVDDSMAALSDEDKAAAKVKAEEALARAKAGEDFATLVTEYSQDPGSLETGGEYTFARGEMVTSFEDEAYSLGIGEISDLVESEYGYHIIKVEEKDIAATAEEIQERTDYLQQAKDYVADQAKQTLLTAEQEKWKADYTVTVDDAMWAAVVVEALPVTPVEETTDTTTDTTSETTTETETTDAAADTTTETTN